MISLLCVYILNIYPRAYIKYCNFATPSVIVDTIVNSVMTSVSLQTAKQMKDKKYSICLTGISEGSPLLASEMPIPLSELVVQNKVLIFIHSEICNIEAIK